MSLGLCGNFWENVGIHRVSTWILNLDGKICIFLSVGLKAVQPSNCLEIHPMAVFSHLTVLALLHLWNL